MCLVFYLANSYLNIVQRWKNRINYEKLVGDVMIIMYDSLTGNVARFTRKLPIEVTRITSHMVMNQDFVLITYTTGLGKVSDTTKAFLKTNNQYLKGIASSGNRNFGTYFAKAADEISRQYNVPIISKFELSGTPTDVDIFMKGLRRIETY